MVFHLNLTIVLLKNAVGLDDGKVVGVEVGVDEG